MNKPIRNGFCIVGAVVLIVAAVEYVYHRDSLYPSTDDAYIKARYVKVASLLNGKIDRVAVRENEWVKKGQVIFTLDSTEYKMSLEGAKTKLAIAKQKAAAAKEGVAAAEQEVQKGAAELALVKRDTERTLELVARNDIPKNEADEANTKLKASETSFHAAEHKLAELKLESGEGNPENPYIKAAEVDYQHAQYQLSHTTYVAATDGLVTNLKLHPGDLVSAGQPLFVIIDPSLFWVEANFSEHKLIRLKPGQPASIHIDMYPNVTFHGVLQSISNSSGDSFSLLPAQNASGNWIKVAQRFPVVIDMTHFDYAKYPVRIGASCEVVVDTRK
jgi:membrane fusion protein (multidrug efflux system)